LRTLGIGKLSGVIVSHDDTDHSGGLRSVLRDIPTGWLQAGCCMVCRRRARF